MPKLTDRLEKIFNELTPAKVFADIGCDHGYIARAMLDSGKCDEVVVTDISEKSLSKAVGLLKHDYDGKFTAVVADGFNGVPKSDEALIAGMGGEEIVKIILGANTLPKRLALQPMKNSDKVRKILVKSGYKLIKDYTFKSDGKFYDYVIAENNGQKEEYSEIEYEYGRGNLKSPSADFIESLVKKRAALIAAAEKASGDAKAEIDSKISELDGIINENSRVL